ncbi:hypothetical protein F511_21868 [Dorcoceras hygrometricum]|uniref:Uncharacterized protein n=1 Tax=Dorcoceras hygrometricum TaxID=472368 RepID=A0A2Z7AZU8_9LAMI|nr:hypothetical protein F511_21868 [Dorcoceras hygrometricum]
MVKRLATSRHDPLGITDSTCKNQLVMVSVQYDPFNTYIPIRSTTIGKSRVAKDPIAMHTSWRSNSDIASVTSIGYPRMKASGESSTTKHRLLHSSGPHPIPPPSDPKFHLDELKAALSKNISGLDTAFLTTYDNRDRVVIAQTNVLHKEMQAQKDSLSKELDAMRKEENIQTLSAHLSELIAYINRSRDDKKGEVSSNQGPQPSDDQIRPVVVEVGENLQGNEEVDTEEVDILVRFLILAWRKLSCF